jgi:hypothetical protein
MDFTFNSKTELLKSHLHLATNMRIEQLKKTSSDYILNNIELFREEWLAIILSQGELLFFKSPSRGETAKIFSLVVELIAHLAFAPEGIEIFGLKFKGEMDKSLAPHP